MTFTPERPLRREVGRSLDRLVAALNRSAAEDRAFKRALPHTRGDVQASLFSAVLETARESATSVDSLAEDLGSVHEALLEHRIVVSDDGCVSVAPSLGRRRAGAHYTPRDLSERLVERTLSPLCNERDSRAILSL